MALHVQQNEITFTSSLSWHQALFQCSFPVRGVSGDRNINQWGISFSLLKLHSKDLLPSKPNTATCPARWGISWVRPSWKWQLFFAASSDFFLSTSSCHHNLPSLEGEIMRILLWFLYFLTIHTQTHLLISQLWTYTDNGWKNKILIDLCTHHSVS